MKSFGLPQMKLLAFLLLIFMLALYVLAVSLRSSNIVWAYVAAFAEAAMVGAIADWFAVEAIFRRPLGLPIAHTALIERHQGRIARNLGDFVIVHFASSTQLARVVRKWDISSWALSWLSSSENIDRAAASFQKAFTALDASKLLPSEMPPQLSEPILQKASNHLLDMPANQISAKILQEFCVRGQHKKILCAAFSQLHGALETPRGKAILENVINSSLINELSQIKYLGLDQMISKIGAEKVSKVITSTIFDMANDENHPWNLICQNALLNHISALDSDEKWAQFIGSWQLEAVQGASVKSFLNAFLMQIWGQVVHTPIAPEFFKKAIETLQGELAGNLKLQKMLNKAASKAALAAMINARPAAKSYISQQLSSWETEKLINVVESHIGRDMQFIRINGTIVGGIIGLLIFSLTRFFT